jgi:hypothetical protein
VDALEQSLTGFETHRGGEDTPVGVLAVE